MKRIIFSLTMLASMPLFCSVKDAFKALSLAHMTGLEQKVQDDVHIEPQLPLNILLANFEEEKEKDIQNFNKKISPPFYDRTLYCLQNPAYRLALFLYHIEMNSEFKN